MLTYHQLTALRTPRRKTLFSLTNAPGPATPDGESQRITTPELYQNRTLLVSKADYDRANSPTTK